MLHSSTFRSFWNNTESSRRRQRQRLGFNWPLGKCVCVCVRSRNYRGIDWVIDGFCSCLFLLLSFLFVWSNFPQVLGANRSDFNQLFFIFNKTAVTHRDGQHALQNQLNAFNISIHEARNLIPSIGGVHAHFGSFSELLYRKNTFSKGRKNNNNKNHISPILYYM